MIVLAHYVCLVLDVLCYVESVVGRCWSPSSAALRDSFHHNDDRMAHLARPSLVEGTGDRKPAGDYQLRQIKGYRVNVE